MNYYPVVVQALAGNKRYIVVYFSDGRITRFNMQPLIDKGGVFKCLENDSFFVNRLTVMNNTAAWDLSGKHDPTDCIDIDPVTLYEAERITDPLEEDRAG